MGGSKKTALGSILKAAAICLVVAFLPLASYGADQAGKSLFVSKKCSACHNVTRPAKDYSPADQLKEKGPQLWYAGSKFNDGFLKDWLKDPKPLRPMAYNSLAEKNKGDHPALGDKEASEIAAYLMTLKAADVADVKPSSGKALKGKFVFQKKLGCYGCHATRKGDKLSGGVTGPALAGLKTRLRPEWIYLFMANQRVFAPASPMPVYTGIIDDEEMKALAEYVSTLE